MKITGSIGVHGANLSSEHGAEGKTMHKLFGVHGENLSSEHGAEGKTMHNLFGIRSENLKSNERKGERTMSKTLGMRWLVVAAGAAMLLVLGAACTKEVEVPGETIIVEKEVVKTVEVPGETIVVEKEVIKTVEVEVPGKTVTVTKEVIKEVEVPGETVVVTKEVIKEVEVPGETVVVTKEVLKVVEVRPGYVTDPTNGKTLTAPEYGGTLTFANPKEPANTDPSIGGFDAGYITSGVIEKLGILNWGQDRNLNDFRSEFANLSDFKGALAESWEQPDPLTHIFQIRKGVYWHDKAPMNGRELTADDVVYNFHRLTGTGSGFTEPPTKFSQLPSVEWESITAIDKYTVVIKLKKARLDSLTVMIEDAAAFMLPPEVIKEHGDVTDWRNLVGTGPFMLTDWTEGTSVTWVNNPNYWGFDEKYPENRLPYIDKLRSLIMPEEATRLAAIRTGKVEYLAHNAGSPMKRDSASSLMRTNPELEWNQYYFRTSDAYALVVNKPPFDDIRVRKALQMSIDWETISLTYYGSFAKWQPEGPIGNQQIGYGTPFDTWPKELQEEYTYNPEKAKKLLADAGYSNGLKTTIRVGPSEDVSYGEIVAGYWSEIGVDAEVTKYGEWATFSGLWAKGDPEGMMVGVSGTPYHPSISLSWTTTDSYWNRGKVNDPVYNEMFKRVVASTSVEELKNLSQETQMYYLKQHWYIWAPKPALFNFWQPWLKGFDGDFYMGVWNKNQVYARLWIDQAMKTQMR